MEASRFNVHSPEKSGLCCAMTLVTLVRKKRAAMVERDIVGLRPVDH
jgi:hypothetical protein